MKQQSLASRLTYDRPIALSAITQRIGDRAQTNTQQYGKRPLWRGAADRGRGSQGAAFVRVPAEWGDAGDGGVWDWGEESDGEDVFGAEFGGV